MTFELPKRIKAQAIGPATANGDTITLANRSGTADLAQGRLDVTADGGVRLKRRGAKAKLTAIRLIAGSSGQLSADLKGKDVALATVTGPVQSTSSGAAVTNAAATLTGEGAKALNRALAVKRKGRASASGKGGKPFKAGKALGTASADVPLTMVDVQAQGSFTLEPDPGSALMFLGKGVNALTGGISSIGPATGSPPLPFHFPVTGGRVSRDLAAGRINSAGGLSIVKNQSTLNGGCDAARPVGSTFLRQTDLVVDLDRSAMLATVESGAGILGVSIVSANLDMSEATKSVSPSGEVTISNMKVLITDVSATTLNFVFGSAAQGCGSDFTGGTSLGHLSVSTRLAG